jgi:phospholipid-translocating ATPase
MSNENLRKFIINDTNHGSFCSNTIKTAKYNIFTFLPLAIVYQFTSNYFNIFFLFTAIILSIKIISPMDPGVALGPFVFVLGISVLREGIEDYVNILLIKEKIQV